jgi:hypothetical protein
MERIERLRIEWRENLRTHQEEEFKHRQEDRVHKKGRHKYSTSGPTCSICAIPFYEENTNYTGLCIDCFEAIEHFRIIFENARLLRSAQLYLKVHPDSED